MPYCGNCGFNLTDEASFCGRCGSSVIPPVASTVPAQPPSAIRRSPIKFLLYAALGGFGLLLTLAIIVNVVSEKKPEAKAITPPPVEAPEANEVRAAPAPPPRHITTSPYLYVPGANQLVICTSEKSLSEYTRVAIHKDMRGLLVMMLAGEAFGVDNGTKVSIVDPGILRTEVRVSSGPQIGRSGWVPTEFVQGR